MRLTKFVLLIPIFTVLYLFSATSIQAQTTTLSIAPPIYEIVTKPGESVDLTYILTNEGQAESMTTTIYPFIPEGDGGNLELKKDLTVYDPLNQLNWFTFTNPNIGLNREFTMQSGEKKQLTLNINVPKDAVGGDSYFTILFETKAKGSAKSSSSAFSQARIGTNLLVYVDDGRLADKRAKIENFSAPLLIDSFSGLDFKLVIGNEGNTFFKPIGEILLSSVLGSADNFVLAPQNILTKSQRRINCLNEEKIVPCGRDRGFLLGIYTAKLYFSPDGSSSKYTQERTVVAFPFTLIGAVAILMTIYKYIQKKRVKPNLK